MKVLAILFGIILILPGLCCLGFGTLFTFNSMASLGVPELLFGLAVTAAAIALFRYGGKE